MIKLIDRLNEAYMGVLGEDLKEKTKNRINWIVNHVEGTKILDIGCSQGIISIILGREGKKVYAIDLIEESIKYAKKELDKEHVSVKENVKFKVSNFITDDNLDFDYDTILLTEVLEHISDTETMLKKIYNHLSKNGILIVTVPFGINDYFDHKRTYYFLDLYETLSTYFIVDKLDYIGKWTGVICKKKENLNTGTIETLKSYSRECIYHLERAFYQVEKEYISIIKDYQTKLNEKNEYIQNQKKEFDDYLDKFKEQLAQLNNNEKVLIKEKQEENQLLGHIKSTIQELDLYIRNIIDEKKN